MLNREVGKRLPTLRILTIDDSDMVGGQHLMIREIWQRLDKFCLAWLSKYKVPMRFNVVSEDEPQYNERFKRIRQICNA